MKKIQLDVTEESLAELRELVQDAGLKSISELINNAATLYRWAVQQVKTGREIGALSQDPEEDVACIIIELPALDALQPAKR